MKRIAYLLCELKSRDLDGSLFLASHLLKEGFAVVIGQRWAIGENHTVVPKGCFYFPTAYKIQAAGMAQVREAGHLVVATDEECIAVTDMLSTIHRSAIENSDAFLALNQDHFDALTGKLGADASKVIVTGSPRLEATKQADIRPALERPYILFNTSFPLVNSIWGNDTAISATKESLGIEGTEVRLNAEQRGFDAVKELVSWLTPSNHIVIRPHPAESYRAWQTLFPTAEVVAGSPTLPWLKGATVMIHCNSTTGLEAALIGVPTLNLNPVSAYGDILRIKDISRTVQTVDEAKGVLSEFLKTGSGLPVPDVSQLFPLNGAQSAAGAIANLLKDALPLEREFGWRRTFRDQSLKDKFTATRDEVISHQQISKIPRLSVHQLDDSVFLLVP